MCSPTILSSTLSGRFPRGRRSYCEQGSKEEAIVRRAHSNRSLPHTLDALIARYCVVFMDCIGSRTTVCRGNPARQILQRVVITSALYFRADQDLSSIIACVRDHRSGAVYLLSSVIPLLPVTTLDVVGSTDVINKPMVSISFRMFSKAFNFIKKELLGAKYPCQQFSKSV